MSTPARSVAARSSASRCSPASRRRCRNSASLESTVSCSPVSASSTTITPASGSSYSRGSSSRIATTSWRSVSCSSGRSHPGAVMKSERRTISERRRIAAERELERPRQVGDRPARLRRAAGGSGRGRAPGRGRCAAGSCLDLAVEQDRADRVAAAGEQAREGRRELAEHELLRPVDRAEPHRRRAVEQEPGRQLAILGVLADERRVHPRGDVPVDVADVVARLVLAEVAEVGADAAEERAVVPLQAPVEAADHLPLEAVEDVAPASRRLCSGCGRCPCSLEVATRRRGPCAPAARAPEPEPRRGCGR